MDDGLVWEWSSQNDQNLSTSKLVRAEERDAGFSKQTNLFGTERLL